MMNRKQYIRTISLLQCCIAVQLGILSFAINMVSLSDFEMIIKIGAEMVLGICIIILILMFVMFCMLKRDKRKTIE